VTIHDQFNVERVAAAKDCTLVALVPTQLVRLLDAGVDMARFRAVLLGGAAAPPTLLERAANAGVRIAATYGMSETAGGCVYDGLPLPEVNVTIQPDSRIAIRGPMLMAGYRNRPDLTNVALKDGWLLTNDIGDIGADHRLHVLGRADDIVITGGENISTTRVAAILMDHPHIRDAQVVGVPDSEWGHRVVAVVVAGDVAPTLEQLRAWVAHRASIAAAPRGMVTVSELPRLASGKSDRRAVADIARSAP
jgi:O-succinylbenzoic acid--CoA ligase